MADFEDDFGGSGNLDGVALDVGSETWVAVLGSPSEGSGVLTVRSSAHLGLTNNTYDDIDLSITKMGGNATGRIYWRKSDELGMPKAGEDCFYVNLNASSHQIRRYLSGTYSELAGGGAGFSSGDVLTINHTGDDIETFKNAVSELTHTDTDITAAGYIDIRGDSGSASLFDTFRLDAGGAPPATNPKGPLGHPLHGPFGGPIG